MKQNTDKNDIVLNARARLKMTQAEFGAAIGRTERLIYKIEAHECGLSRYVVAAVQRLLAEREPNADPSPYTDNEREIIRKYRLLHTADRAHVAAIINGLAGAAGAGAT
jgi:DNA-binding XRE family transcriptional regulator